LKRQGKWPTRTDLKRKHALLRDEIKKTLREFSMSRSKLSEGDYRRSYLARTKKMPCAKKKNEKG
jgi:hypothetical protein